MKKISFGNFVLIIFLTVIVFAMQFILAGKQLEYGFYNDDWYVLGWYKQEVKNPLLDIPKAWRTIGSHNFVHAYYMGLLFDFFKYDYFYYHLINTSFKALAALSLFPVILLLFKKKFFAVLATLVFAIHFSPFGVIYHVIGGEGSLIVIGMNLFLSLYIYASQKHILNRLKIIFILLVLLLAMSFFEVTRAYPLILFLPFLELVNFFVNKSSTNFKQILLRLFIFYAPFIVVVLYSPGSIQELNFNKFIRTVVWGNYQLILSMFASFGSTFVPEGLIKQLSFTRFLIIALPVLLILSSFVADKLNWILRSSVLLICFLTIAFWAANHWLYIDPKLRAPVDPGTYLIPGLIGLFILVCTISFFISWWNDKENKLYLILFLAPIFSLFYTFLTWILVDDNAIFMGVHAYLNVAAMGSSIFLATLFYLAFQNLRSKYGAFKSIAVTLVILYLLLFVIFSSIQIDAFFSEWLKQGFSAKEQQVLQNSFWREVGKGKSADKKPILVYHDTSQDMVNDYFYANSIVWDIPAMLTVEKGLPFDPGGYCKSAVSHKDIDKLRVEEVNGKKVIIQNSCGYDIKYEPDNFFAFRMKDRDLIPIKSEILEKLEIKNE